MITYNDYWLAHHGVQGQKWGVQNGPPYPLDREAKEKAGYIDKKAGKDTNPLSLSEKFYTKLHDRKSYYSDPEFRKKTNEAADIGLRAIEKMRGPGYIENFDQGDREWFLFEDQTMGMPTIANLIREGHSAKECKDFIKEAEDYINAEDEKSSKLSVEEQLEQIRNHDAKYDVYWSLAEGDGYGLWGGSPLKEFADLCEEVRDANKKTVKHGFAFNLCGGDCGAITYNDYWLAHHGVQGQRWGVRNAEWYPIADWEASKRHGGDSRDRETERSEKKLNKLQAKTEKLKNKLDKYKKKETKANTRAAKALKRTDSVKSRKLLRKSLLARNKTNALEEKIKKHEEKIKDLVSKLREKGFEVEDDVLGMKLSKLTAADYDGDTPIVIPKEQAAKSPKYDEAKIESTFGKEFASAIKDCEPFDGSYKRYMSDKNFRKAANNAADLGLKALTKMNSYGLGFSSEDLKDPKIAKEAREWFLFEDQTLGMPEVSDLIANKNYTSSKAKDTVKTLGNTSWYDVSDVVGDDDKATKVVFAMNEGYGLEEFADACWAVKSEENKRRS